MKSSKPDSVNKYIADFPKDVQRVLRQVRSVIKQTAPEADESIGYGMPAYKLNGKPLVYFAGYKNHIGLYATPTGHAKFSKELSKYKQGKGSVQFPLDEPMPLGLIERIVRFRADENMKMDKAPGKKRPLNKDTQAYNDTQSDEEKAICDVLAGEIDRHLPEAENKIWHRHPVWFLEGNPTVGYSKLKAGIRLMFWSGADFEEEQLKAGTGKFKDASLLYTAVSGIDKKDLKRWLEKSREIQWDYKNLIKRRGRLERLK